MNASGRGSIPQHSEARQEATEDEYQDGNGDLAGFCRGDLLHESLKKLAALYVGGWLAVEIASHGDAACSDCFVIYSQRKATNGSTWAARRAGM